MSELDQLGTTAIVWNGEIDRETAPNWHRTGHYRSLRKHLAFIFNTGNAPDEAPATRKLTLETAGEPIASWSKKNKLPHITEINSPLP